MSVSDSVAKTQASLQRWERVRSMFGLKNAFRRIAPDAIATVSYQAMRKLFDSVEKADDGEYHAFANALQEYVPSFLPDIPLENYIAICRGLELIRFQPGEIVVSVGDVPDAWYFIVSGSLDVYRNNADAKEKKGKLASKNFGSHFGEMAFFSNAKRRTATVCSSHITKSVVLKVRKFKYEKYIMALHKDEAKVMERKEFFNKCKMLKSLTPSGTIQLAYSVKEHKYEPFTEIRAQGEEFHCIFAIISGNLTFVHKFPGSKAADITLATLGPTHLAGFVDYISCRALDPHSIPYHRCAMVTGRNGAHVYKISSLSFSNVIMSKLGNEFLELAKIRKSFEIMRISNAIKHPDIRVNVTMPMLEAYGYIGTRAIEVLKETRSSAMEQESKKRVFKRANEARGVHKQGLNMLKDNKNVVSEVIARRLRYASHLYKDASELAMNDNMVRRSQIAKKLSIDCMIPVHKHTYYQNVKNKTKDFIEFDDASVQLNDAQDNISSLMRLENICRPQLIFWTRLHSFCFYHHLKVEEAICTRNMKWLASILKKVSLDKAHLHRKAKSFKVDNDNNKNRRRVNRRRGRSFFRRDDGTTRENDIRNKPEIAIVIPKHKSGHSSQHGKSKQTPSDLLNVARRKHTILRPKPPQQNQSKFTSAESKRLFEITRRVSTFMKQEEHAMFETHHVVPTRPMYDTSRHSSFRDGSKSFSQSKKTQGGNERKTAVNLGRWY